MKSEQSNDSGNLVASSGAVAAGAVTLFLILTAWGNALAMSVVSAIALLSGIILYRADLRNKRKALLIGVAGCVVAFTVSFLIHIF